MKEKLKIIGKALGFYQLYGKVLDWWNNKTCQRFECSVGDILLLRDVPNSHQLLLTSRLLDVEEYISKGNETFPYQNAISYKTYGKKHREADGNSSFKALIESYMRDGYHSDSYITCDREMTLLDGNHRMGLQIYEQMEKVSVRMLRRRVAFEYSADWYYRVGLPTDFMERIFKQFSNIQKWLIDNGMTFCAYINTHNSEDLTNDFGRLCRVLNVISINMGGVLIQFSMPNPDYTAIKGKLVSKRALMLEDILRKRAHYDGIVKISKNCLEGKELFNEYIKG